MSRRASTGHLERLKRAISLAVRAEPALIRDLRLTMIPDADPGIEADLYFDRDVQHATSEGVVLDAERAEDLRRRFATDDPAGYDDAWRLVGQHHESLTPALRLEEEVLYLAHSSAPDRQERIRRLLLKALAALVSADRRGLAGWAARALPRFPNEVLALDEAKMLRMATSLRLGNGALAEGEELPDGAAEWLPWIAPTARSEVGVTLKPGLLEVRAPDREGETPGPASHVLPVLRTEPLVLDVLSDEGELVERVRVAAGKTAEVRINGDEVRLRTLLGEEYVLERLDRSWERDVLDFDDMFDRHQIWYEPSELEEIREALSSPEPQILLVTGPPGSGKTALLSYLATEEPDELSGMEFELRHLPHHFCRREVPAWIDTDRIERSLVAQIVDRVPDSVPPSNMPLYEAMELWRLAREEAAGYILIIDALDELSSTESLAQLVPPDLPADIKIICSTRSGTRAESWLQRHRFVHRLSPPLTRASHLEDTDPSKSEKFLPPNWESSVEALRENQDVSRMPGQWWNLEIHRAAGQHETLQNTLLEKGLDETLANLWNEAPTALRNVWSVVGLAREAVPEDLYWQLRDSVPGRDRVEVLLDRVTVDDIVVWLARSSVIAAAIKAQLRPERHRDIEQQLFTALRNRLDSPLLDPEHDHADRFALAHALHHAFEAGNYLDFDVLLYDHSFLVWFLRIFGPEHLEKEVRRRPTKGMSETVVRVLSTAAEKLHKNPHALPALVHNRQVQEGRGTESRAAPPLRLVQVHRRGTTSTEPTVFAHRGSVLGVRRLGFPSSLVSWGADGRVLMHGGFEETNREILKVESEIVGCGIHLGEPFGALAVATRDGTVVITDLDHPERGITYHLAPVRGLVPIWPRGFATFSDHQLQLWNDRGALLHNFRTSGVPVTTVCSLSDSRIAAGCADGSLIVWSLETGKELARHEGHTAPVTFLAPGSTYLASAGEDATVRLWDLQAFEPSVDLVGHGLAVTRVGFAADDRIVSASLDGTARVWATETGEELAVLEHGSPVTGMLFRTGELITTALDGVVRRWPDYGSRIGSTIDAHSLPCRGCAAGPDEKTVATWDDSGAIRVWELETGNLLSEISHRIPESRPLIAHDRGWIAFDSSLAFEAHLGQDQTHHLATIAAPTSPLSISKASGAKEAIFWNTEGFGTFRLQDPADGSGMAVARHIDFHPWPPDVRGFPVAVDSSGPLTISAHGTGIARYVAMDTTFHELHERQINGCSVIKGDEVLTWSRDATLQVSGKRLEGHRGPVLTCVVDHNRVHALSASTDASVRHWNLQTGQLLQVWEEIDPHITALHLDVDQHVLLAGTFQGDVILLSRTERFTTRAPAHARHDDRVRAFEPYPGSEGRRFYSISDDGTIKLWEIVEDRHGRHLLCLETAYADDALLSVSAIDDAVAAQDARHDLWIYRYTPPEDPRLRWASKTVPLHERPDLDSRLVMTLEPTTALERLERRGEWLQVRPLGRSTKAWVRDDDLDPVSSGP